jgi:hypothetical protein
MSDYLIVFVLTAIALGAIAFPILVGRHRYADPAELEADVERYRRALRHDSLCARCRQANPPESEFCGECGHPLGGSEAPPRDGERGLRSEGSRLD